VQRGPSPQRARRLVALVLGSAAVVVLLMLTAFSGGSTAAEPAMLPPLAELVVSRPPAPQVVALQGSLRLQLPVSQTQVTAIGYHDSSSGALPLEPVGIQGNRGLVRRLVDRMLGTQPTGIVWYRLERGAEPDTALDVGAPAGADVFAPVDGTVVGITGYVLNGKRFGARIDIRPANNPSLLVSLARLEADPTLEVGDTVVATTSRLGTVLDLAAVEEQALARYTSDGGNHVTLEVRAATTLSLP
jgi:hypothetical protein